MMASLYPEYRVRFYDEKGMNIMEVQTMPRFPQIGDKYALNCRLYTVIDVVSHYDNSVENGLIVVHVKG